MVEECGFTRGELVDKKDAFDNQDFDEVERLIEEVEESSKNAIAALKKFKQEWRHENFNQSPLVTFKLVDVKDLEQTEALTKRLRPIVNYLNSCPWSPNQQQQ